MFPCSWMYAVFWAARRLFSSAARSSTRFLSWAPSLAPASLTDLIWASSCSLTASMTFTFIVSLATARCIWASCARSCCSERSSTLSLEFSDTLAFCSASTCTLSLSRSSSVAFSIALCFDSSFLAASNWVRSSA